MYIAPKNAPKINFGKVAGISEMDRKNPWIKMHLKPFNA